MPRFALPLSRHDTRRFVTRAFVQSALSMPLLALGLLLPTAHAPAVTTPALPTTAPTVVVTTVRPVVAKPASVKARPSPVTQKVTRKVTKKAVRKPAVRTTSRSLTGEALMLAAVARIPGSATTGATWVMTSKYGNWGVADWQRGVIYISPSVPARRMYDVVAHEWSHLLSVRPYASTTEAKETMNHVFGGSGLTGAERAADCMALHLGATWTHYTACTDRSWQSAAAELVAGQRI